MKILLLALSALPFSILSLPAHAQDECTADKLAQRLNVQNEHVAHFLQGSTVKYNQTERRDWSAYESSLLKGAPDSVIGPLDLRKMKEALSFRLGSKVELDPTGEKSRALDSFLGPDDIYFDSGTGMGIAAIHAHMNTQASVVAVNPLFHLTPHEELIRGYLKPNGLGYDAGQIL